MSHVFISYSTQNSDYAYQLADKLRAEGFDVWIDNRELRSGVNWWESIVIALKGCAAFIVVMTPQSRASKWVQREVGLADQWDKPLFPVLLAGENWEIFVYTQFENVRIEPNPNPSSQYAGKLPPPDFFDRIGEFAPRQLRQGENVLQTETTPDVEIDAELAEEIANPPPIADATPLPQPAVELPPPEPEPEPIAALLDEAPPPEPEIPAEQPLSSVVETSPPEPVSTQDDSPSAAESMHQPRIRSGQPASAAPARQRDYKPFFPPEAPSPEPQPQPSLLSRYRIPAAVIAVVVVIGIILLNSRGTPSAAVPIATMKENTHVYVGPDLAFESVYGYPAGHSVSILARTAAGDWYRVENGWIEASAVTVSGDVSNVPVEQAPPTPTPASTVTAQPTIISSTDSTSSDAPKIDFFTPSAAAAAPGESVILNWSSASDSARIDQLDNQGAVTQTFSVVPTGSLSVQMSDNGDTQVVYRLTVTRGIQHIFSLATILITSSSASSTTGQIAFRSTRNKNYEIYLMNADGSNLSRLTNNRAYDSDPAWSPDGTQIAFESDRDGNSEIYVMNADGSNPHNLTGNPAHDSNPAWSPDGTRIAFQSDRDGNSEIYVMNTDGTDPHQLTNSLFTRSFSPAWSPDSSQIAFFSLLDGGAEIYVMDADGGNPQNLTNNAADDGYPAWSPDGTQIVFRSDRDGTPGIYVMNANGGSPRNLTSSTADDAYPGWSPDGTQIVFQSNRDGNYGIYVMNADGGNLHKLTNNSDDDQYPAWRPAPKS